MKALKFAGLGLALVASQAFATPVVPPPVTPPQPPVAGTVTIDAFNNATQATVSFNDGAGHSGTDNTLLTQFNVTYHDSGSITVSFLTYCIDLFHTVSVGQTYAVTPNDDLDGAYANGARMAYIFDNDGSADLSADPDRAAAVQIALWDLSLNNHNPTSFGPAGGTIYDSGDSSVFSVDLGSNPDAAIIAGLVNQYLSDSIGASTTDGWLDGSAAGDTPNRGQSLLIPDTFIIAPNGRDLAAAPEPSSAGSLIAGLFLLGGMRGWRRLRQSRIGVLIL